MDSTNFATCLFAKSLKRPRPSFDQAKCACKMTTYIIRAFFTDDLKR